MAIYPLAAGCRFYEPPKTVYAPDPDRVLKNLSGLPVGDDAPAGQPGSAPGSGFTPAQPGDAPGQPAPDGAFGGRPRDGGPSGGARPDLAVPGGGTATAPAVPQFPPEDPQSLIDRLATIAEAVSKYAAANDGRLPVFGQGPGFREALLPYLSRVSAWPERTMVVPRGISGLKLADIPNRSETPLLIAGPRGTDGKAYAIFADLTVRPLPEAQPPPGQGPTDF